MPYKSADKRKEYAATYYQRNKDRILSALREKREADRADGSSESVPSVQSEDHGQQMPGLQQGSS